jgi:hypothetical protein
VKPKTVAQTDFDVAQPAAITPVREMRSPDEHISLAVVEPPELKLAAPDARLTVSQIESHIDQELATEEMHRQGRAIAAMRAGAWFYCLKQAMAVSGRKYTGFWEHCEKRFNVARGTVSKKMRLVAIWAGKNGAKAELITQLAEAAKLEPSADASPAVQLAFDWIADLDLSDLYRREKLTGQAPTGGNTGNHTPRRAKAEIDKAALEESARHYFTLAEAALNKLYAQELYAQLDDESLALLRENLLEIGTAIKDLAAHRGLKRLPATWRQARQIALDKKGGRR